MVDRTRADGLLCSLLAALLACGGCSSTHAVGVDRVERALLRRRDGHVVVRAEDGSWVRIDPHTELRFILRDGGVTRWARGHQIWRSKLGVSFIRGGDETFVGWREMEAVEVRNLSGGKTFGAVLLGTVIIGVIVVAVIAMASSRSKGPKLSGFNGGGVGKSSGKGSSGHRRRVVRVRGRRLARRGRVHLHLPLLIVGAALQSGSAGDAGPPPGPPPPPPPPPRDPPPEPPNDRAAESAQPVEEVVDIHGDERPTPATRAGGQTAAARAGEKAPAGASATGEPVVATPLFDSAQRRRAWFQLIGSVSGGTELVRFPGGLASLMVGVRLREIWELTGGVRYLVTEVDDPARDPERLHTSFIGFGRLGLHLPLDSGKRWAASLSVDAGAGHQVDLQLKLNIGLRYSPLRNLTLGLYPFNPMVTGYGESSRLGGAWRLTFPTTFEVGFAF